MAFDINPETAIEDVTEPLEGIVPTALLAGDEVSSSAAVDTPAALPSMGIMLSEESLLHAVAEQASPSATQQIDPLLSKSCLLVKDHPAKIYFIDDKAHQRTCIEGTVLDLTVVAAGGHKQLLYLVETEQVVGTAIPVAEFLGLLNQQMLATMLPLLQACDPDLVAIKSYRYRGKNALPKAWIREKLWKRMAGRK